MPFAFAHDADLKSYYLAIAELEQIGVGLTPSEILNLETSPSNCELAILSHLAYKDYLESNLSIPDKHYKKFPEIKDFQVISLGRSDSYQGCCFFRRGIADKRHHQLVIAHKGTKGRTDVVADYDGVVKNQTTPQLNSACTFAIQVFQQFETKIKEYNIQIIITGHSLGGWLGQVSAFALKRLEVNEKAFKYLDNDRCHPHCKFFDSPGAMEILRHINTLSSIGNKIGIIDYNLDITNFAIHPNSVNVVNSHYGDLYNILGTVVVVPLVQATTVNSKYSHTKKTHAVWNFINCFRQDVEHQKLARVVNWPLVIFKGANTQPDSRSFGGWVGVILTKFTTRLAKEMVSTSQEQYDAWLINKEANCKCIPESDEGVSCCLSSICEEEQKILEKIREFFIWKKYTLRVKHVAGDELLEHLNLGLGDIKKDKNRLWVQSGNVNVKNILRNCRIFFPSVISTVNNLPGHLFASFIYKSQQYCEQTLAEYFHPKFIGNLIDIESNKISHVDKDTLGLILLEIISAKCNGCEAFNKTLIVKYDRNDYVDPQFEGVQLDYANLNWFNRIIIDCTDVDSKSLPACNLVCKYSNNWQHIWVFTSEKGNCMPQLDLDESTKNCILSQDVILQGNLYSLENIVHKSEFFDSLKLNPECLLACLCRKVELDLDYKTLLDFESTYFEVGINYSGSEICQLIQNNGSKRFVICSNASWSELYNSFDWITKCIVISNENALSTFQAIAKQKPQIGASLINYVSVGKQFTHSQEYIPEFYVDRMIKPPSIEIAKFLAVLTEIPAQVSFNHKEPVTLICDSRDKRDEEKLNLRDGELIIKDKSSLQSIKCDSIKKVIFHGSSIWIHSLSDKYYAFEDKPEQKEVDVFNDRDFLILSSEPGIGKTSTIIKLIEHLVRKNERRFLQSQSSAPKIYLVLYIELKSMKIPDPLPDSFEDCFVQILSRNLTKDKLTTLILSNLINFRTLDIDLTLIFDGFDEMEDSEQERFCHILTKIRCQTKFKVFLTTREQCGWKVMPALWTLPHKLIPMNDADKCSFLMKLWSTDIRFDHNKINRVRLFAEATVLKLNQYLEGIENLSGAPLNLRILSQIFLPEMTRYLNEPILHNPEELLHSRYSLTDIYKAFVERKYKIYNDTKLMRLGVQSWGQIMIEMENNYERYFFWLAGNALEFGPPYQEMCRDRYGDIVRDMSSVLDRLYGMGLVYEGRMRINSLSTKTNFNSGPRILHKTLAEFFSSKFLFKVLLDGIREMESWAFQRQFLELFTSQVCCEKGTVLQIFLDEMMESSDTFVEWLKSGSALFLGEIPNRSVFLEKIVKSRHPYLLGFAIQASGASFEELENFLRHLRLNLTIFYLKSTRRLRVVFVLLFYLSRKPEFTSFRAIRFLYYRLVLDEFGKSMGGKSDPDYDTRTDRFQTAVTEISENLKELKLELAQKSGGKKSEPIPPAELVLKKERYLSKPGSPGAYPGSSRTLMRMSFYYSINDVVELFTNSVEELGESNPFRKYDISQPAFILVNPAASLILLDESLSDLLGDLERLVKDWVGEFDHFPYNVNGAGIDQDFRMDSTTKPYREIIEWLLVMLFRSNDRWETRHQLKTNIRGETYHLDEWF